MISDVGFYAPDLEIVILARTSFGTVPTRIANFWLQGPWHAWIKYTYARSLASFLILLPHARAGKMRMEIDLVPRYPHMQTMAVTFLGAFRLCTHACHDRQHRLTRIYF